MNNVLRLVVLLMAVSIAAAQPRMYQGHRAMERLENLKKIKMLETLKLEENVGLKLVGKYNAHRERLRDLENERSGLVDRLDAQLKENASDADFQKTFSSLLDVEKRFSEERAQFLNELKEILTTKQIAQYIIFERSFARDLRDVMRDVQRERMRR